MGTTASKIVKWFLITAIICFFVFAILVYRLAFMLSIEHEITVIIPNRTSVPKIADLLNKNGASINRYVFYGLYHLIYYIHHKPIQAGEYKLVPSVNMLAILYQMIRGEVVQHKITIPEGYTLNQLIELLRTTNSILPATVSYNTKLREGYFLPDTYKYTYGMTDFDILHRMQQAMNDLLLAEWPKRDARVDDMIAGIGEALILASIVERESVFDDEKPSIASVYLNRLKGGMRLQADPTVIYGMTMGREAFNRRVTYRDLKHDSLYNTYLHSGLPPTPICNPGKGSILAVLHPTWHNNLFFVANGSGRHTFSETFSKHKLNIRDIRR